MTFIEDDDARARIMKAGFGNGFPFWASVVVLQRERLEALLDEWPTVLEEMQELLFSGDKFRSWTIRSRADAHFLLVAGTHILKLTRVIRDATKAEGHDAADDAYQAFLDSNNGRAEMIRGCLEHWDRYGVGGKTDLKKGISKEPRVNVEVERDEVVLTVGDNHVQLLALAYDLVVLARELDTVWHGSLSPDHRS